MHFPTWVKHLNNYFYFERGFISFNLPQVFRTCTQVEAVETLPALNFKLYGKNPSASCVSTLPGVRVNVRVSMCACHTHVLDKDGVETFHLAARWHRNRRFHCAVFTRLSQTPASASESCDLGEEKMVGGWRGVLGRTRHLIHQFVLFFWFLHVVFPFIFRPGNDIRLETLLLLLHFFAAFQMIPIETWTKLNTSAWN